MDDDRLRSALLELYEEGTQDPPPMPAPQIAELRERRSHSRWLLAGGAGVVAAAVVALVFVVVLSGHRSATSVSGNAARQPSAAPAAPTMAPPSQGAQPDSADSQLSQGEANVAARPWATCAPRQLQASYGGSVSLKTGEHSAVIRLRNMGSVTCVLAGYPAVHLVDAHGPKAFRYQNGGVYPNPARNPLQHVELAPGASAHFMVAKVTCQVSSGSSVSGLTYAIGSARSPVVVIPDLGTRGLQYCPAGGNLVSVGPFAPGVTP